MKLSVEQKINQLRPLAGSAGQWHKWLLAGAILCFGAALLVWHPWPAIIGAFLGLVGLSEKGAGPNLKLAIGAYDTELATHGEVMIEIQTWDTIPRYYAKVTEQHQPAWEYEFKPIGWTPINGLFKAKIWRADQ